MVNYQVTLRPVYSCPADEIPDGIKVPQGWRLSWHQVETWKALNDPDVAVIINSAMTGDGKSLAAYLDAMQGVKPDDSLCRPIGLYPTNELARDQESQIQGYIDRFRPNNDPRVSRLSGATLEIYAESEDIRKDNAILTRIDQSDIILTNPDILHYLHRHAYITPKDAPDKLWSRLDVTFNLFIHDEFHVFSAPQIASVINTMLLMRHTKNERKHLFLSATPEKQLFERLKTVFAAEEIREINPYEREKYRFPDSEAEKQQLESQGWRQIARQITLNFIPIDSTFGASETWLLENWQLIRDYFLQYPGSKGAIILNSIASVKRLIREFKNLLHPLTVAENTGLTGQTRKNESLQADLVLGTSTIDVGVDFRINFLIFESGDSGSFIQRLGRLGRHDGQSDDQPFLNFTAHALASNFLVERLFLGEHPPLEKNVAYDRPFLNEQIRDKYRKINNFQGYFRRWAGVQSVEISRKLNHKTIRDTYQKSRVAFEEDCQRVFQTSLGRVRGCLQTWREDWQQLSGQVSKSPIEEDASSFRGSSSLSCGLYDEAYEDWPGDYFKTYDLPGILSNLDIEPMTQADYLRLLESTAARLQQPIAKGRFRHCLAFMKLLRYRPERRPWRFSYGGDLRELANSWKVQVLRGIQVYPCPYRQINERMKTRYLVSYLVPHPVEEVKKRLQLPMHFQIYPIDEFGREKTSAPYSIAFGQSALLLDTQAYRLKDKGGDSWIC
ncbi:MAG: type I-D CRISPR-associated helicase Cas3' [Microcystis viridis Mv_BB_P_19951000_S69]|uniref:Type I-D CRISPR-associated helicase Cas3 n=1 Tax=Microcystis viridis Mv_BB_P_19951000_S68D TaxID=2486270 RepID=A0A552I151_MICVR|nr:MAG: type I-D CRISPR-associated helicase Cas3' [Microcystis viridis Mv_BB_P_19951000_S68]TRU72815.1 MAG: type I-D CRISPR-associated helicase Cas3' [Microcystis viridis Mv_BB_P_19951000_S69]TRU77203.1 MAG: type I-D CRISPR-associated helicase Cas3' [Microcystis viridis Mv_BB_P_19951000_S68D]TRU85394.1 MAG: type I-D CRISPR-associated helicase Cas3' [Microcystis viridis Mv_BB_P_19951000_S69D]